jgi:hypothetical protein
MAKKKIDPKVQRMMDNVNRTPTVAEEADFYKRNAGGPMVMTSMTRGDGAFRRHFSAHVEAYDCYHRAQYFDRKFAEGRRTFHHEHIAAYSTVYWAEWARRQQHPHTEHIRAWFYHLHPQHKQAWRLNPFLLDP